MTRKLTRAASAAIIGLAFGAPAFAHDHGGGGIDDSSFTNTDSHDKSLTVGDITLSPTYSPSFSATKTVTVTKAVADQDLRAVNVNFGMHELVNNDDEGYSSGNNGVSGSAFAAFAGILNQGWNTGIDANTQAANNVAAVGTVNFHN
jgi:hypothetical protein